MVGESRAFFSPVIIRLPKWSPTQEHAPTPGVRTAIATGWNTVSSTVYHLHRCYLLDDRCLHPTRFRRIQSISLPLPPFKVLRNPRKLSQRHRYKTCSLARSSLPFFSGPSPIPTLLVSATRVILSCDLRCSFSHPLPFIIELGKVLEIVGGWSAVEFLKFVSVITAGPFCCSAPLFVSVCCEAWFGEAVRSAVVLAWPTQSVVKGRENRTWVPLGLR